MSSAKDIDSLLNQGRLCLRGSNIAGAIEVLKQAIDLDGRRTEPHELLATAYFIANDLENAVVHFKRASDLDPRQGKPLINLGAVYNRLGKFEEASRVLRKGIQRERSHSEGFYNLGYAHKQLKQLSLAVSAYREAVRIDPLMTDAHVNLANVFFEMRNYQKAIVHFKAALEVKPDLERAKQGLASTERAAAEAKKSISPFGRLVDTSKISRKSAPGSERILTETERLLDRQLVHGLSLDIKTLGRAFLAQVKNGLDPAILQLNRAVAEGVEAPYALSSAIGDYQKSYRLFLDRRRELKRKMLELRAHEELMHSPAVKPAK